jgi:hypothetical protein
MKIDDQGPMQKPRSTRDVMKAAPAVRQPGQPEEPDEPATDAATQGVKTDQESG